MFLPQRHRSWLDKLNRKFHKNIFLANLGRTCYNDDRVAIYLTFCLSGLCREREMKRKTADATFLFNMSGKKKLAEVQESAE